MMQRQENSPALNLRVGGRLAAELMRIARTEQNSVSAVARRLIVQALESKDERAVVEASR
jgi:hypothetical protein